jgi:hypothetical protein
MRVNSTFLAIFVLAAACKSGLIFGATVASDEASQAAYADGWQNGDNGGTGFKPWSLAYSGVPTGLQHDPQFIARSPLSGNLLATPAFGLTTSDRDTFSDTSEAVRTFNAPIGVGHILSIDLDGSELGSGGPPYSRGNTFQLIGSDGQERFSLYTSNRFNGDNWSTHRDVNTGVSAGSAFRVNFTLATANTYNLALLPIGGGNPLFTQTGAALAGTPNAGITRLRVSTYGTGSSANGTKELFFRSLMVNNPNALSGDYNADGTVNAADYVLWREHDRSQAGYGVWRNNFGRTAGSGAFVNLAVPEPASCTLIALGATFASWCLRRRSQVLPLAR